ncbi:MAG: CDP-alcohol phosphatidyltransferase family protein [Clostridia bacterium]|nr:CDP-alcohol phosphatidyltransferase family protein [Clostridia bacterium]
MIGFFDYTVILTYLSLVSATTGIIVSLSGTGHPYIGAMFLLFCGLCDAFDGKVARMKKDRTKMACNYGIQIDSLSDLVAFGVLPASIGFALLDTSDFLLKLKDNHLLQACRFCLMGILVLYVLAAMIRLAYFNVTEEERQSTEGGETVRKTYTGLPVTSASIILPSVLLLSYAIPKDIAIVYFPVVLLMAVAFVSKFQLRKPQMKHIMVMVAIGVAEAIAIAAYIYLYRG